MGVQEVVKALNDKLSPVSTFLYGSRARTDALERSDYEIGALFRKNQRVEYKDVREVVTERGINVYPFVYEDFLEGRLDTPFQQRIYMRELIVAGKTLSGKKVLENMDHPKIRASDIKEDLRFNCGYALAAIHPFRNGDLKSASLLFYKSCLFATRDLVMFESKTFPLTYDEILKSADQLDIGINGIALVQKAYNLRQGRGELDLVNIVENITFINDLIEGRLDRVSSSQPDLIMIE